MSNAAFEVQYGYHCIRYDNTVAHMLLSHILVPKETLFACNCVTAFHLSSTLLYVCLIFINER